MTLRAGHGERDGALDIRAGVPADVDSDLTISLQILI